MKTRLQGYLLAAGIALGGEVRAQTAQAAHPITEADRVFELGREASVRGDFTRACEYFRESLRLDPTAAGTLVNLGDCEENQGHPDVALAFYERAFARLSVTDERLTLVQARIESLEHRSARLELRLGDGAPKDAKVTLDGRVLEPKEMGVALLLTSGNHLVVVTAVGYRGSRQRVGMEAGTARKLTVWPGPPLEEATPAFVEVERAEARGRERRASMLRTAGIVSIGLGVASLWAGSITGLFALDREHLRRDNCDANDVCNRTGYDAARQGSTLATVSTITFAAGGAATAGGLYLILSNRSTPAPSTAGLAPGMAPNGAGLSLRRAF